MRITLLALCALLIGCAPEAGQAPRTPADERKTDVAPPPDPRAAPRKARPWGKPVSGAENQKQVIAVLTAVGDAAAGAQARVADVVTVGPALWALLVRLDGSVKKLGTPSQVKLPTGGGGMQTLEMRVFVKGGQVSSILRARSFQRLLASFASGRARAAAEPERRMFYALIPFEIAGKPLTVVDAKGETLVAVLVEGRLIWVDLLSGYGTR